MPYPAARGRCRVSQSTVRRPTASSAPGSSKRCVAAGTIAISFSPASSVQRLLVERNDRHVRAAYDEKRRRTHIGKTIREIGPPAPRHHRVHIAPLCRGGERGGRSRARAVVRDAGAAAHWAPCPTNVVAASTRSESSWTSKRNCPVRSFTAASLAVSRSARNDANPASYSMRAVSALRVLRRLLPLP